MALPPDRRYMALELPNALVGRVPEPHCVSQLPSGEPFLGPCPGIDLSVLLDFALVLLF